MTLRAEPDLGPRIRILVADDHPVVRAGLLAVLSHEPDFEIVGEAEDGARCVALAREFPVDVALIDLHMPGLDGVDATRLIAAERPQTRVLVLSSYSGDALIRRALRAGARGYLLKDMLLGNLVAAVRAVNAGGQVLPDDLAERLFAHDPSTDLSPREANVLSLVARGLGNRAIAKEIDRSEETVKAHLKSIFAKLAVSDRTEAVTVALARGLIELPDGPSS